MMFCRILLVTQLLHLTMFQCSNSRQNLPYDYDQPLPKFKEKNIISAILGTATIVVLCASVVEPVWFTLQGGSCCLKYLGINSFLSSIVSGGIMEIARAPDTTTGNKCDDVDPGILRVVYIL